MIIDTFLYNGEEDLLEIRLGVLGDVVDEFRIVEAATTFCQKPKELLFKMDRFKKWEHKIKYYVNNDQYSDEDIVQAYKSPNTGGNPRWMHEFLQKEYPIKILADLDDEDVVFYGDVDEIWNPELVNDAEEIYHVRLRVYTYYLNLYSNERFWGTVRMKYKDLKGKCLNHFRKNQFDVETPYMGWHFTNQGGLEAVLKKMDDQYNTDVFTEDVKSTLPERFGKEDIIMRPFTFKVDESNWPSYLVIHKGEYRHLLK